MAGRDAGAVPVAERGAPTMLVSVHASRNWRLRSFKSALDPEIVGKIGTAAGFQSSAGAPKEEQMKFAVIALSIAVVIASAPAVLAKDVSSKTPGHEMQKYGKKAGPRASSYAPGRRLQTNRSNTGYPGTFGYVPNQTKDITDIRTKGGGGY